MMSFHSGGYQPTHDPNQAHYEQSHNAYVGQGGYLDETSTSFDTPSKSEPGSKRGRGANQSLFPVTIKQILNASQSPPEDNFKIDGQELHQITVVGCILEVRAEATNMSFKLDDGTGTIDVRMWLDADEKNEYMLNKRQAWREHVYVRVVGHIRSFQGKRSILAFRLEPLVDYNELTYHLTEVLYVHLCNLRGIGIQSNQVEYMQNTGNMEYNNPYMNQMQPMTSGGMDPLQSAILQIIQKPTAPEGTDVRFLCQQLGKPEHEVRNALEYLSNEGHVYSTIDDDHFLATDQ